MPAMLMGALHEGVMPLVAEAALTGSAAVTFEVEVVKMWGL